MSPRPQRRHHSGADDPGAGLLRGGCTGVAPDVLADDVVTGFRHGWVPFLLLHQSRNAGAFRQLSGLPAASDKPPGGTDVFRPGHQSSAAFGPEPSNRRDARLDVGKRATMA